MKSKTNVFRFISNVFKEKCPKCKNGATFQKDSSFFSVPEMNTKCSACDYRFDREPGYFIGAMYLSYGLALAQGGLVFILAYLFLPPLSSWWILTIVILTFLVFAKKNFKWSRILYIYIFPW